MFEVCIHMTAEYVNHLVHFLQLCARSNKTCTELDCKTVRFCVVQNMRAVKRKSYREGENGE